MPTKIFHITHCDNLAAILQAGELRAVATLPAPPAVSVAHNSIQARRATTRVPCGPGGCLHDYVPFYFGPRSPMLYALHRGSVAGYADGEAPIVHLVCNAEDVASAGHRFVFTDGHAAIAYSEYYDDLAKLGCVDLALMRATSWADTPDDPDRKRRRQAEFLVHERVPWSLVERIVVRDGAIRDRVESVVRSAGEVTPVEVQSRWYYGEPR